MNRKQFRNPANEYRPAPFWSLNDELEEDNLRYQIAQMEAGGWGGFFMHSRIGLVTPYLSREWFDAIKICVDEAKKRGMLAWMYDEDKWPSGYAGGIIPRKSPNYRCRFLGLSTKKLKSGKLLKLLKKIDIVHFDKTSLDADVKKAKNLYFYRVIEKLGEEHFNGTTYVDLYNPATTQEFIKSTHEKYKKCCSGEFGKTIPGIFTDEPNGLHRWGIRVMGFEKTFPYYLPWTDNLPAEFKKDHGYDILNNVMGLFFDVGDYKKVRYDYFKTLNRLLINNFSKALYDWCEANNLELTGHYLSEEYFDSLLDVGIPSLMPHYEYMQTPGIDHLTNTANHPHLPAAMFKQMSSVAGQFGRKRTLCEIFGAGGQELSFERRRWLYNWNLVHGINLFCPHLYLYSMRSKRKRDFPPTISHQQPYWKYNKLLDDQISRQTYVLSQGKRKTGVLVLNTIESAWLLYRPVGGFGTDKLSHPDKKKVRRLFDKFARIVDYFLEFHYETDLGDEELIARHGSVHKEEFVINKKTYRVVVVPPCETLRSSTVRLLKKFEENGGTVIFVKNTPKLVDGRDEESVLLRSVIADGYVVTHNKEKIKKQIQQTSVPKIDIAGKGSEHIYSHWRSQASNEIIFLTNVHPSDDIKATVTLPVSGRLNRWNASTGKVEDFPARHNKGKITFVHTFVQGEGLLLAVDTKQKGVSRKAAKPVAYKEAIGFSGRFNYQRLNPNALTIERCRVAFGKERWSKELYYHEITEKILARKGSFKVRYTFDVEQIPAGDIALVMEAPEVYPIKVNGNKVTHNEKDFYIDYYFKKIDITGLVREGKNEIVLEGKCSKDTEIECIYIVGDFAVSNRGNKIFSITREKEALSAKDLVHQGYPFYAGEMVFKTSVDIKKKPRHAKLTFAKRNFIVAKVRINGKDAGEVFWKPYEVDVASLLRKGANEIEITLVNSLRNLLGPFHTNYTISVDPEKFRVDETDGKYLFAPFGLDTMQLHLA